MKKVTITWKAFGNSTSVSFDITPARDFFSDAEICSMVFADTNKYEGVVWETIKDRLPEDRTHTALSVGDEVTIDDVVYRCEPMGWSVVSAEFIELES